MIVCGIRGVRAIQFSRAITSLYNVFLEHKHHPRPICRLYFVSLLVNSNNRRYETIYILRNHQLTTEDSSANNVSDIGDTRLEGIGAKKEIIK